MEVARLYVVYAQGTVEATTPRKVEAILNGLVRFH